MLKQLQELGENIALVVYVSVGLLTILAYGLLSEHRTSAK